MKQQPRFNGRVGLYSNYKIEQFRQPWSTSWGPTPSHWYDASDGDLSIDKISDGSFSDGSSLSYSSTQNGKMVANADSNVTMVATHSTGSFTTTHFIVLYVNNQVYELRSMYDPAPSDTGPGGGGNYNHGESIIKVIPGAAQYQSVWSYTGVYPLDVVTSSSATQSVTSGSYYIFKNISNHSSTTSVTGWSNGATASSQTLSGGIIAEQVNKATTRLSVSTNNKVAEIICYDSTLSSTDQNLVSAYLKDKWGLTY